MTRRLVYVMLNPSTADETEPDQTLRKCLGFARAMGYDVSHSSGAYLSPDRRYRYRLWRGDVGIVNLYAFRTKSPSVLWKAEDPVGPGNDEHILEMCSGDDVTVVAAWGAHARPDRAAHVRLLLEREKIALKVFCEPGETPRVKRPTLTSNGNPRHPLMLPYSCTVGPWRLAA